MFRIFEVYQNEDAFKDHMASEHFKHLAQGRIMPELAVMRLPSTRRFLPRRTVPCTNLMSLHGSEASAFTSNISAISAK